MEPTGWTHGLRAFFADNTVFWQRGPVWMVNFRVRDPEAMAAQLRAVGISVEMDPEIYPNGIFARIHDPEGNAIELWHPRGRDAVKAVEQKGAVMELGVFSVSLSVKDIAASRAFYEKFGFRIFAGDQTKNWLILKNGPHVIGLFQGMFEKNTLTFNPGWDSNANKLATFTDIRDLQRQVKAQGVTLDVEADETTKGPASFLAIDPDGNPILVDQHV